MMNDAALKQEAAEQLQQLRSFAAAAALVWGGEKSAGPFEEMEQMLIERLED
jgi:hypothetical protein